MKSEQFYLYEFIRKLRTVSSSLEVVCFLPMHTAKVYLANYFSFLLIYLYDTSIHRCYNFIVKSVSHRYALDKEEAPLLKLLHQVLVVDSVSHKAFYSYKVCATGPETHCVRKLLRTSPQREHKIIVTPSATNPTPEFLLYLCVRASPGWSLGAEEQGVKCHIYRCLLLALADISQIFRLQEREKEKENYTFHFLRGRNVWWDAHFQCILIIYWRNLLKDTLKSYQRTTEVTRQCIFYPNK